jgi:hypothetical protein
MEVVRIHTTYPDNKMLAIERYHVLLRFKLSSPIPTEPTGTCHIILLYSGSGSRSMKERVTPLFSHRGSKGSIKEIISTISRTSERAFKDIYNLMPD